MFYPESKIYCDGSHYIAIPHSTNPTQRRPREQEEPVFVIDVKNDEAEGVTSSKSESKLAFQKERIVEEALEAETLRENTECVSKSAEKTSERKATRTELFNEFYKISLALPKRGRRGFLVKRMRPYFVSMEKTREFVDKKIADKIKSLIARRTRFIRKAYMNDFNYFATFTYDDKLHTEQSFKRKLLSCLSTFQKRKGWRYMGVWERGAKTGRLHFHGLFWVPEGAMPGELIEKRDYNLNSHNMKLIYQNTYFNSRFGRTDMKPLDGISAVLREAITYILKYLEKSGEKIVYSHGLNVYVVSDVDENDVVCCCGIEDKKLLLFDNFTCWDEGEYIGEISADTKKRLRSAN